MPASLPRLAAAALLASVSLAAIGFGWEAARFGASDASAAARVERDVRRLVADRSRQVASLATRVAREEPRIAAATASRDQLPELFSRLVEIARPVGPVGPSGPSATVYVPTGAAATFRVLAWSGGPAEDLRERLSGPRALFLAPGTVGLRLIALEPVESAGRRIAVASAEAILAPRAGVTEPGYVLQTDLGRVQLIPPWAGAGAGSDGRDAHRFVIAGDAGETLIEGHIAQGDLRQYRRTFRARVIAAASLPLLLLVVLGVIPILERRRGSIGWRAWAGWSFAAVATVGTVGAVLALLARLVQAPLNATLGIAALAAAATAVLLPVSAWWRRSPRISPTRHPVRFVVENGAAGAGLGLALFAMAYVFRYGIRPATLERWQLPLMPLDAAGVADLATLLVAQIAIGWSIAAMLALLAVRWHVHWRRPLALAAAALWLGPIAGIILLPGLPSPLRLPITAGMFAAAAVAGFAIAGAALRRYYRHTSQAMRLLLLFAALVLPAVAVYPMGAASADDAARALIEQTYAPATALHTDDLIDEIARVEREIDRIPRLEDDVSVRRPPGEGIPSQLAFQVWSQTTLAQRRLTSEIELYGPDRMIVSRFALNVPEFESLFEATTPPWQGTSCQWEDWSEVARFGASERSMLHSERGICDAAGAIIGAIVVHIVPDYRDLPFVTSLSAYYEVVGGGAPQREPSRVPDLQIAVYGWSLAPLFTSGSVAWPIPKDVAARLTATREPFWRTIPADDRTYRVYFMNNRGGIYALGYPPPTLFQHLTRLAEIAVVAAIVFVGWLAVGALAAPLTRRQHTPLRVLFHEIRTSFYRKLFLFFVLAAIGPVLLFALAFGAYMAGKFRADVEAEAADVVSVARRVLEELTAAIEHPDQTQPLPPDDVMVWIRQVVDQDVNLFNGPQLVATSQRDLFDSGLLPTRTPADVYRAIALDRLPVYVGDDQLGEFHYLVAAAPVGSPGRELVLTVPLATRQREIDAQIDELNRGVLVGAVVVVLFAAGLGASVAGRVSDPVARLTRATRLIAAGKLDVRLVADTADELGRLVDDFNSMAHTLVTNRDELARSQQIKAWAEMARQVAHEIKNPLTPIQLAAEHLQRVHEDQHRPLGAVFDQCLTTVLGQVRLLRRIASEFSNFAGQPTPRPTRVNVRQLVEDVIGPYRLGVGDRIAIGVSIEADLPPVRVDRTLVARALTNLVENAVQAMASGGRLRIDGHADASMVTLRFADSGPGMDEEAVRRAFEPYFSTKTAGSGLGLANARRNIELSGGSIQIESAPDRGTAVTVTLPVADRDEGGIA